MRRQPGELGIRHRLRDQHQGYGQAGDEILAQDFPVFQLRQPLRQFEGVLDLPQRAFRRSYDPFRPSDDLDHVSLMPRSKLQIPFRTFLP